MTEATIKMHKSYGSVWKAGELLAGHEKPDGGVWQYTVFLCVKARVLGARGGVKERAEFASISSPSWTACCCAVQSLGFTRPTLTAASVRDGYRSAA